MNVGYFAHHVVQYGRAARPWCRTGTLTGRVSCILAPNGPKWRSSGPQSASVGTSAPRMGSLVPPAPVCSTNLLKTQGKLKKSVVRKGLEHCTPTPRNYPKVRATGHKNGSGRLQSGVRTTKVGPPGATFARLGGTFGHSRRHPGPSRPVKALSLDRAGSAGITKNHEKP